MTAISVSERLLEMAAFYTPLALTVTENLAPLFFLSRCVKLFYIFPTIVAFHPKKQNVRTLP